MRKAALKPFLFAALLALVAQVSNAQQLIWSDDFETIPNVNWSLNTADNGSTVAGENRWVINDTFAGVTTPINIPNTPNQPAGINNSPQSTYLHITSFAAITTGSPLNAHYSYVTPPANTEQYFAAMTSGINTSGFIQVEFKLWYINEAEGAGGTSGQMFYSTNGGTTWVPFKSVAGVNNWIHDSVVNPAFDNKTDLRFGFMFDNPATGGPAGFGIDDIVVTGLPQAQPVADFTASKVTVCEGECISFTDLTTNFPTTWLWSFPGADSLSSTQQNPSNICYQTAGLYDVTLTAQSSLGAPGGSITKTAHIEVVDCTTPPNASFTVSRRTICAGDTVSFTDLSSNVPTGWTWFFPGSDSSNSTLQNPTNIRYSAAGRYEVTLIVTNPGGTDQLTQRNYITVESCISPIPVMTTNDDNDSICVNDCITISYDVDSGNIEFVNTFDWTFFGIDTSRLDTNVYDLNNLIFNKQQHTVCYSRPGRYNVGLRVGNQFDQVPLLRFNFITVGEPPVVFVEDSFQQVYAGNPAPVAVSVFDQEEPGSEFYWFYKDDEGEFKNESPDFVNLVDDEYVRIDNWRAKETEVITHESRYFYILQTDRFGCNSYDSTYVEVIDEHYAGVPDIFSPNNDGYNDILRVRGNGIALLDFRVYDRYGSLIFQTEDREGYWDGTVDEQPLNPGVFIYVSKVTYIDGSSEDFKGNVSLVR